MNESELLATFYKLTPLEWFALIAFMLLAMVAHALKKLDEAKNANKAFSVREHFEKHVFAVLSSLLMQLFGLYYLVETDTATIFTAVLLGLSAESVGGWIRSKSQFKP